MVSINFRVGDSRVGDFFNSRQISGKNRTGNAMDSKLKRLLCERSEGGAPQRAVPIDSLDPPNHLAKTNQSNV